MDRARLKENAKYAINSNQPSIILIFLISILIAGAASFLTRFFLFIPLFAVISSICITLFSSLMEIGFSYCCLKAYNMENPDMSISEAITRSTELMDGHKADLFILDLSFILWYLLCGITFGIAILYVGPYVEITKAGFYNDLTNTRYKYNS